MLKSLILALAASTPGNATPPSTPPFACRADALDKTERQRQQQLLQSLAEAAVAKHELGDGWALSFPGDSQRFLELAEWVGLERRCCPFLEFALEWKTDDGVRVRVTGAPGAKEFIEAEMGFSAQR